MNGEGELCKKCVWHRPTQINLGFGMYASYGDPHKRICNMFHKMKCGNGTKMYWSFEHGWMNPDGTINEKEAERRRRKEEGTFRT